MVKFAYPDEKKARCLERRKTETQQTVAVSEGVSLSTIRAWERETKQKPPDAVGAAEKPLPAAPKNNIESSFTITRIKKANVLVIPDMHHPFVHRDALEFLKEVKRVKKTNINLCLGDEIDAASFSKYIPDPDGMTPGQELQKAIESLTQFYVEFPQMLVCESNHTVRPWKKAFAAGLPKAFLPTYSCILNAPDGWHWRDRWEIDNVLYLHGDNGRSGQYAAIQYMKAAKQSVVIGHIHSFAGVNYEGQHFAVNAGCLIDEDAYCFKYAKNMLVKVNLGCAVIYEGKYAEFVPMRLDDNKRWIGRL